jgi:hypothetical protein
MLRLRELNAGSLLTVADLRAAAEVLKRLSRQSINGMFLFERPA